MVFSKSCPIGSARIDDHVVRVNAVLVFFLGILSGLTDAWGIMAFLAADFLIKSYMGRKHSPLDVLSRWIIRLTKAKPHMVNAAPKAFAARIGLFLAVTITGCHLGGYDLAVGMLTATLVFCAGLEGFLGFCVGCQVYMRIPRRGDEKSAA